MTPIPAETRERIDRIAGFHFEQWRIRQGNKSLLSAFKEALTQLAEEERREREKASREIVSEVQYLPKGSIVRENVLRLLGALPNPPTS